MEKINLIAKNVHKKDGIWYSLSSSEVSYPSDANKVYNEIEQDSFWFKHRNEIILSLFNKLSNNKILYDIGGGNGYVSIGLQNEGIETILVEPGINGAENAKLKGINNIICSTFQDAGFIDEAFENVGLFDVLEHIEDDLKFLRDIHKYLNKEGKVFITVPAFSFLWSQNDDNAGHFRRYTTDSLTLVANKAGFEVEYISYFFSILPLPIFLFRSIPYLLGIRFKDIYKKGGEEHKKGFLSGVTNIFWDMEKKAINNKKSLFTGSSCVAVFKKVI